MIKTRNQKGIRKITSKHNGSHCIIKNRKGEKKPLKRKILTRPRKKKKIAQASKKKYTPLKKKRSGVLPVGFTRGNLLGRTRKDKRCLP